MSSRDVFKTLFRKVCSLIGLKQKGSHIVPDPDYDMSRMPRNEAEWAARRKILEEMRKEFVKTLPPRRPYALDGDPVAHWSTDGNIIGFKEF